MYNFKHCETTVTNEKYVYKVTSRLYTEIEVSFPFIPTPVCFLISPPKQVIKGKAIPVTGHGDP
jgi:hypothetical protein